jgi:Polyketide cyclase / dehydrase and lipid transport
MDAVGFEPAASVHNATLMPMPRRKTRETPTVDVVSEIEIRRPRGEVAAFVCDQDNAPAWNESVESVEWESSRPLDTGSGFTYVAELLGRRLDYRYEVVELVVGNRLVVSTDDGPFSLQTTYTWADAVGGATAMTLRNQGQPEGSHRLTVPLIARAMRRANAKNLQRLKRLLEQG